MSFVIYLFIVVFGMKPKFRSLFGPNHDLSSFSPPLLCLQITVFYPPTGST